MAEKLLLPLFVRHLTKYVIQFSLSTIVSLTLCGQVAASTTPTIESIILEAQENRRRGYHAVVIKKLQPLLSKYRLRKTDNIIKTHRLLAVAYFHRFASARAENHLESLLRFEPKEQFTVKDYSPKFIRLAERVRRRLYPQPSAPISTNQPSQEMNLKTISSPPAATVSVPNTTHLHNTAWHLLPFGIGHFRSGNTHRGWWYLSLETVAATLLTAMLITVEAQYTSNPEYPPRDHWQKPLLLFSSILLPTIVAADITDGLIGHRYRINKNRPDKLPAPSSP